MARAASVGPLVLVTLQLAACRGLLGLDEDMPPVTDGGAPPRCTTIGLACAGEDVLRTCASLGEPAVDERCAWGCSEAGAPRCLALIPSGGAVQASDLAPDAALGATVIGGPVTVSTDDGSITGLRASGPGIAGGIGYVQRAGVAIFTFASLVVDGAIQVRGALPAAFVARGDITVNQLIDARGDCTGTAPGPGGAPGGATEMAAPGEGGGQPGMLGGQQTSGGGGGGHGAAGGVGGSNGAGAIGGAAGVPDTDAAIARLRGGWGGGGGGGAGGGLGGGGGGAIQLVSEGTVTFGGAAGSVNAGGCGGEVGTGQYAGGGGGGAGGAILVEAPVVRVEASARLAANGGGGGGGRGGTSGEDGLADAIAAGGGAGGSLGGAGGAGGVTGALAGRSGVIAPHGGGGGGGTGRIRLNTRRGAAEVHVGARLSPALGEPATSATEGVAATR